MPITRAQIDAIKTGDYPALDQCHITVDAIKKIIAASPFIELGDFNYFFAGDLSPMAEGLEVINDISQHADRLTALKTLLEQPNFDTVLARLPAGTVPTYNQSALKNMHDMLHNKDIQDTAIYDPATGAPRIIPALRFHLEKAYGNAYDAEHPVPTAYQHAVQQFLQQICQHWQQTERLQCCLETINSLQRQFLHAGGGDNTDMLSVIAFIQQRLCDIANLPVPEFEQRLIAVIYRLQHEINFHVEYLSRARGLIRSPLLIALEGGLTVLTTQLNTELPSKAKQHQLYMQCHHQLAQRTADDTVSLASEIRLEDKYQNYLSVLQAQDLITTLLQSASDTAEDQYRLNLQRLQQPTLLYELNTSLLDSTKLVLLANLPSAYFCAANIKCCNAIPSEALTAPIISRINQLVDRCGWDTCQRVLLQLKAQNIDWQVLCNVPLKTLKTLRGNDNPLQTLAENVRLAQARAETKIINSTQALSGFYGITLFVSDKPAKRQQLAAAQLELARLSEAVDQFDHAGLYRSTRVTIAKALI